MENNLIVIENGQLNIYLLDNQVVWEVGRMSKEHTLDIPMHATTISRRHGRFQNMDGIWFYMDENPKNGTIRNQKKLSSGLHGRVKPVMVSPGDVFVFGGGENAVVSPATVWAFFRTRYYDAPWRAMDSRGCSKFLIVDGATRTKLADPEPGSVVECEHGMVIYMGTLTYVIGPLKVMGSKGSTDGTNYYRTN